MRLLRRQDQLKSRRLRSEREIVSFHGAQSQQHHGWSACPPLSPLASCCVDDDQLAERTIAPRLEGFALALPTNDARATGCQARPNWRLRCGRLQVQHVFPPRERRAICLFHSHTIGLSSRGWCTALIAACTSHTSKSAMPRVAFIMLVEQETLKQRWV